MATIKLKDSKVLLIDGKVSCTCCECICPALLFCVKVVSRQQVPPRSSNPCDPLEPWGDYPEEFNCIGPELGQLGISEGSPASESIPYCLTGELKTILQIRFQVPSVYCDECLRITGNYVTAGIDADGNPFSSITGTLDWQWDGITPPGYDPDDSSTWPYYEEEFLPPADGGNTLIYVGFDPNPVAVCEGCV